MNIPHAPMSRVFSRNYCVIRDFCALLIFSHEDDNIAVLLVSKGKNSPYSEAEMCKIGLYPSLCSGALFFAPARTYVADSPSLGWGVGDMLQKLPRWIEV